MLLTSEERCKGSDTPDSSPPEFWTRDAKRILELSLRYSIDRGGEQIELSDLEHALSGTTPPLTATPQATRVLLPVDIAEELISNGDAVRPFVTRGGDLGEVTSIVVDAINTGSALVSISLALMTLKRLAAAMVRRRQPTDPNEITISVTMAGRTERLLVDRSSPRAEDEVLDFLLTAVDVK